MESPAERQGGYVCSNTEVVVQGEEGTSAGGSSTVGNTARSDDRRSQSLGLAEWPAEQHNATQFS